MYSEKGYKHWKKEEQKVVMKVDFEMEISRWREEDRTSERKSGRGGGASLSASAPHVANGQFGCVTQEGLSSIHHETNPVLE